MNNIILALISGIVGLFIGIFTLPIITKNLSFLNNSGQLGSLFSFIWIFLFVLAGLIIGYKISLK
jgi:hypothetical protein